MNVWNMNHDTWLNAMEDGDAMQHIYHEKC